MTIAPSGMRVRHLNLTHPSHSAALLAPLAKDAGGWGLCAGNGQPVFRDNNDEDYQKLLKALATGVTRQEGIQTSGIKQLLRDRNTGVAQPGKNHNVPATAKGMNGKQ